MESFLSHRLRYPVIFIPLPDADHHNGHIITDMSSGLLDAVSQNGIRHLSRIFHRKASYKFRQHILSDSGKSCLLKRWDERSAMKPSGRFLVNGRAGLR